MLGELPFQTMKELNVLSTVLSTLTLMELLVPKVATMTALTAERLEVFQNASLAQTIRTGTDRLPIMAIVSKDLPVLKASLLLKLKMNTTVTHAIQTVKDAWTRLHAPTAK